MHGSGMGKTACVLQGVLHAESTRDVSSTSTQVHLRGVPQQPGAAFQGQCCQSEPNNRQQAEEQGFALVVEILKAVLNPDEFESNGRRQFELQDNPPTFDECVEAATKLLRDAAGAVLVHFDEFMRLFETTTPGTRTDGVEHVRTGALAVLAAAASSLGRCGDDAGTPRCTTMCTFIKPPDATDRSNLDCSLVGVPCVDEQQYAAKSLPRLLNVNPSECELDGAAIDDAATEKLRQKGMPFLRDYLVHNNHGGLTGLQTGSAELVAFETRIIECTATTGAKKPAGCGQFVPAGILPPPSPRSGKAA